MSLNPMFIERSITRKALERYSHRVSSYPIMWGDSLFNTLGVNYKTITPLYIGSHVDRPPRRNSSRRYWSGPCVNGSCWAVMCSVTKSSVNLLPSIRGNRYTTIYIYMLIFVVFRVHSKYIQSTPSISKYKGPV